MFWNWAVSGSWKGSDKHNRENLNHHDQILSRNMDTEDTALKGQKEVRNMLVETRGRGIVAM